MKRELKINPAGDIGEWVFSTGHWCGQVRDSVGVRFPSDRGGCVFSREDVRVLRKFLEQAEAEWDINPPSVMEILNKVKTPDKKDDQCQPLADPKE